MMVTGTLSQTLAKEGVNVTWHNTVKNHDNVFSRENLKSYKTSFSILNRNSINSNY